MLRQMPPLTLPKSNRLQTAPTVEPVTLKELRDHLRISHTDEDSYLEDLITEARQEIEDITGIALNTQTWMMTLDHWPPGATKWWDGMQQGHINEIHTGSQFRAVELSRYPLISVTGINVYDTSDNATAVTVATVFEVNTAKLRGTITLKDGQTWPVALRETAAIEITYTAGYGATAAAVPAPLRRAVKNMAAYMYEHRGDCDTADAYRISGAANILRRYADARI